MVFRPLLEAVVLVSQDGEDQHAKHVPVQAQLEGMCIFVCLVYKKSVELQENTFFNISTLRMQQLYLPESTNFQDMHPWTSHYAQGLQASTVLVMAFLKRRTNLREVHKRLQHGKYTVIDNVLLLILAQSIRDVPLTEK
jgi:hypothetical protein